MSRAVLQYLYPLTAELFQGDSLELDERVEPDIDAVFEYEFVIGRFFGDGRSRRDTKIFLTFNFLHSLWLDRSVRAEADVILRMSLPRARLRLAADAVSGLSERPARKSLPGKIRRCKGTKSIA